MDVRSRAPAWSALGAARGAGVGLVTTFHGAYGARGPLKQFYNSSMVRGDAVIANSQFTARRIIADYPRTQDRMVVIPRGADLAVFSPSPEVDARAAALRARWLGPKAEGKATVEAFEREAAGLVLLLPARLSPWKGHEVAIDALAVLKNAADHPRFAPDSSGAGAREAGASARLRLVFCGDLQNGALVQKLRHRAAELGVEDMIVWAGHCADMPAAYAAADLTLAPSTRPEAFGRTAVEAGAMARIVIAADHGGARETVVDGETGFLAARGDAHALAAQVKAALALEPAGRAVMTDAARRRIAASYSIPAMTAATLGVYRDLAARGSHHPSRRAGHVV